MQIFRTAPDSPAAVEIGGVGLCGAYAKGGVPVEDAATLMSELQDPTGEPLSGRELTDAAKRFAEARGLVVTNEEVAETLPQELGAAPPRPPAAEVAQELHERIYGAPEPSQEVGVAQADVVPQPAADSAQVASEQTQGGQE